METYTVCHARKGPVQGLIVGRLGDGRRFLAQTHTDPAIFDRMVSEEIIGLTGKVTRGGKTNVFDFN